ncbi:hypothetical protein HPP92_000229 [Vanilla planifolia]|uniref:Uncharacterized protein n=1 Tax=Vanilla planifolia TaxID=51239 RepID=A0A835RRQ3_VANPL|nr:hypothetical protein HPP92_000229 [Vanilla planifolia]
MAPTKSSSLYCFVFSTSTERGCPSLSPSAQVEGTPKAAPSYRGGEGDVRVSLRPPHCQEEYVAEETEKHFSIKDGEEDERHWRDILPPRQRGRRTGVSSTSGLRLHGEKPWMGRFRGAVACLSLAAKMEKRESLFF